MVQACSAIQAAFLLLPPQSFEARRIEPGTASSESLARFDTNDSCGSPRRAAPALLGPGTHVLRPGPLLETKGESYRLQGATRRSRRSDY